MDEYQIRKPTFPEKWLTIYGQIHYNRRIEEAGLQKTQGDCDRLAIRQIKQLFAYTLTIMGGTVVISYWPQIKGTLENLLK